MEIIAVPAIVSLVFSIMQIYKKIITNKSSPLSDKHKEQLISIIPIIGGVIGLVAGIACFYAIPTIIPTQDITTACLVGTASGLSATGCNQIFKQLHKVGIVIKEQKENDKHNGGNDDTNNQYSI